MGYTIYWKLNKYDEAAFERAVEIIRVVIDYRHKIDRQEWGICFDAGHENFCMHRHPRDTYGDCATRRRFPYTADVMKAVIVMVECGMASEPTHDDEDNSLWLSSLKEVRDIVEMKTYAAQKAYFKRELPLATGS
jgi:hypothetical protein